VSPAPDHPIIHHNSPDVKMLLIGLLIAFVILLFARLAPPKWTRTAHPGDVAIAIVAVLLVLLLAGVL
jgi:hypothetical protein